MVFISFMWLILWMGDSFSMSFVMGVMLRLRFVSVSVVVVLVIL